MLNLEPEEGCATILATGASLMSGLVFLISALASLSVINKARSRERQDDEFYFAEAFCWISIIFASVFIAYATLDMPSAFEKWRKVRCAPLVE